ncbi:MAG: hypothetical protein CBD35_06495 [Verrucomicrobia bacterium TMED175]|nr:MAG: hypothetical protein CBD35_06495 [Verrucomicrobia bacterium TMED175]
MNLKFELVDGNSEQILVLYDLLKNRKHFISHNELPRFNDHKNFVLNHPYRFWYLVKNLENYIGTFNIKFDNSIGLNLKVVEKKILIECFDFINKNFLPKPPIKSITPNFFYVNVSASNIKLIDIMNEINMSKIQISYKI